MAVTVMSKQDAAWADYVAYRTFGGRLWWEAWWARYGGRYMEVAAGGVAVTSPAVLDAAGAVEPFEGSDGGEAVAAAPAVLVAVEVSCVGDGPPEVAGADASAALIVSGGCAAGSAAVCAATPPARPVGQRSLRNDIAREILFDLDPVGDERQERRALGLAQSAIDAAANWVLVFGPQALIDEVSR